MKSLNQDPILIIDREPCKNQFFGGGTCYKYLKNIYYLVKHRKLWVQVISSSIIWNKRDKWKAKDKYLKITIENYIVPSGVYSEYISNLKISELDYVFGVV
jgi:hypothetical protein